MLDTKHQYDTVQVQWDELSERWWVYYLDENGKSLADGQPFKEQSVAVAHALGVHKRGNAANVVIYDAEGNWCGGCLAPV